MKLDTSKETYFLQRLLKAAYWFLFRVLLLQKLKKVGSLELKFEPDYNNPDVRVQIEQQIKLIGQVINLKALVNAMELMSPREIQRT